MARCEAFNSIQCSGTVFYDVSVNATYSQVDAGEQAAFLLGVINSIPGVSVECRDAATLLLCALYFTRCETYDYPPIGTLTYSVPPCRPLCTEVNDVCADALDQLGQQPLPCLDTSTVTGLPFFPDGDQIYPLPDGTSFSHACNSMVPSADEAGFLPNRLVNGDFESYDAAAVPYNWTIIGGGTVQQDEVYGRNSTVLVLDSNSTANAFRISQWVFLNQYFASGLRIAGDIRTEAVSGGKGPEASIRVHIAASSFNTSATPVERPNLTITCDGSDPVDFVLEAQFEVGSHAYQLVIAEAELCYPIASVEFVLQFTGKSGKVFVDNLRLQEMVPPEHTSCVLPFYYRNDWRSLDLDTPCQLPCPFTLFPIEEHRKVILGRNVMSSISLICLIFVLVTFFARRRKSEEKIDSGILHMAGCVVCVSLADILPLFSGGWSKMECQASDQEVDFDYVNQSSNGLCAVTGALTQFGSIAALYWWAAICFNLFWVTWKLQRPALCGSVVAVKAIQGSLAYGLGVITMIIALGLGEIGAQIASTGCWVMGTTNPKLQFWLLYYHIVAICILGTPATLFVMISLYRTRKKAGFEKARQGQIRLAAFLGLLIVNFVTLVTYRFYIFELTDDLTQQYGEEVVCAATPGADSTSCDRLFEAPSVGLLAWNSSIIAIDGFLLFLLFGTTQSTWRFWTTCWRSDKHSRTTVLALSHSRRGAVPTRTHRTGWTLPSLMTQGCLRRTWWAISDRRVFLWRQCPLSHCRRL